MFNILVNKLPDEVLGVPIYTDYRYMIQFEQLIHDKEVPDEDKVTMALKLFYKKEVPNLSEAWNKLLWFYRGGEEKQSGTGNATVKRLYDFEAEANLIYASFLDGHHIRLSQTDMHWWEFRILFLNLPEGTPMHDRLMYRSIDSKDFKGEEKKKVIKMQKLYALKAFDLPIMTKEQKDKAYLDKMNKRYAEVERCRIEKLNRCSK